MSVFMGLSNVRFFHDADNRDVTLSVEPAAEPACPPEHLLLPDRSRILRVTGEIATITAVYAAPRLIDALAVVRHRLGAAASWRLEIFSDAAQTELVWDSGERAVLPVKPLGELVLGVDCLGENIYQGWEIGHGTFFFPQVDCEAWRLTVFNPGETEIDISRVIAGRAFVPEFNPGYGLKHQWVDPSRQTRTDGGTLRSDARAPYRRVEFALEWLGEDDRRVFFDLRRKIGIRHDLFISLYPMTASDTDRRDGEFHAKFTESGALSYERFKTHSSNIVLEEV